ncbi:MAG: hypothetical protein PVF83_05395 [Anaerolineales bacterium]|jgi:DNA repair photolyase
MKEEMLEYCEEMNQGDFLKKFTDVNDLLIATYHLATYGGCEFGCAYCDAWSYSDQAINEKICSYSNLLQQLPEELENIEPGEAIGLNLGDPYQPAEKRFRLTRRTLELLNEYNRPVFILTKSPSVLDDLDLLKQMNADSFAIVATTIVTLSNELLAHLEAGVPPPEERIEMIATFKRAGVPCGFVVNPIIPYLTDGKEAILSLLRTLAKVSPDFIVWDYLWIPNDRHRNRIEDLLGCVDSKVISKFDTLYENHSQPSLDYREEMDRLMIQSCRELGLEPRVPVKLYQDHLNPDKVEKLKERRMAFLEAY